MVDLGFCNCNSATLLISAIFTNGLINWHSKNLTIREKKRDAKDTERKVVGSPTLVNQSFGVIPTINRINLIEGLLDGSL